MNARGVAYDGRNEFEQAIQDFSQAIRLDPKNARAFNNRGFAYRSKGDIDRAIADYSQALAINPATRSRSTIATSSITTGVNSTAPRRI